MNENKKVVFTLSIGYVGATHEDEFTLEDLGYEPEHDIDIEEFLQDCWVEWSNNYIDGGFRVEEDVNE